jgi:hypothetical protein
MARREQRELVSRFGEAAKPFRSAPIRRDAVSIEKAAPDATKNFQADRGGDPSRRRSFRAGLSASTRTVARERSCSFLCVPRSPQVHGIPAHSELAGDFAPGETFGEQ